MKSFYMVKKHIDMVLTGEIQNVGFSFQVMKAADQFNIKGYAAYFGSETLKIEAEGKENGLMEFIGWVKSGDHGAKLSDIEISWGSNRDYTEFAISDNKLY